MVKLEKEVTIRAPLEKIFSYINEPSNLSEFWPSLIEINNVKSLPNGGYRVRYVYKMAGLRLAGTGEYTQIIPNQFIAIETSGGISSMIAWTFRSMENLTRVTLTIDYKVPIPLLGKLAEAIIVKMNDQEGDLIMANLRARFMLAKH